MTVNKQQQHSISELHISPGSTLGKEYVKAMYCHIAYLTYLYAEYIIGSAGLDDTQARIKISGRNINNLRYTDDTTLMHKEKRN